jgi:RNA polymerase sigma-70 factor (ECF subfamily)
MLRVICNQIPITMTSVAQTLPDENDLVSRARLREENAIRTIIQSHNRRLYRIARGILRDDTEAEDVLQDTYIKAFLHLGEFRGDASIGTWLCRIAMNEALERLRRRRPMVDIDSMTDTENTGADVIRLPFKNAQPDPERATAQRQIKRLLEREIDRLPEEFRMVVIARVVEGMSVEETSTLLDIEPATVKTRLHRARDRLRTALEAQIGPVMRDVFPFDDPRCARIADNVVCELKRLNSGNLS